MLAAFLIAFAAATLVIVGGIHLWRLKRHERLNDITRTIQRLPPATIRGARDGQACRFVGTVRADVAIEAPLSGRKCVSYVVEAILYNNTDETDTEKHVVYEDSNRVSHFVVRTPDGGHAHVRDTNVALSTTKGFFSTEKGTCPRERIDKFMESRGYLGGGYVFEERALLDGAEVVVGGTIHHDGGDARLGPLDDGWIYVADKR